MFRRGSASILLVLALATPAGTAPYSGIARSPESRLQGTPCPVPCAPVVYRQQLDGIPGNRFIGGQAVAVDGDTAVVGVPRATSLGLEFAGAADVYERQGSAWVLTQRLTASNAGIANRFGNAVDISGDVIVVGAPTAEIGWGVQVGLTYVFERTPSGWVETEVLRIPYDIGTCGVGGAVAIDGDTLVVAGYDCQFDGAEQGGVYVHVRTGSTWPLVTRLRPSDGEIEDGYASAVAISGDTIAIGAPRDYTPSTSYENAVYLYERTGSAWTETQKILAPGAPLGTAFGDAVALSGDTLLVGAWAKSRGANVNVGEVHVYGRESGAWTLATTLEPPDLASRQSFGFAVALSGDLALVGAWHRSEGAPFQSGSAFAFVRECDTWSAPMELLRPAPAYVEWFGWAVDVSGSTAVVGAPSHETTTGLWTGMAYVFECDDRNEPPACQAGADADVECGRPARLAATASDPDGDPVSFAWSSTCPDATFSPSAFVPDPQVSFGGGCGTTCTFSLRVEDGRDGACDDDVTLTVVDSTPPLVVPPAPLVLECNGPGGVSGSDPAVLAWLARATAADACGTASAPEHDAPALFPAGCAPGTSTIVTFLSRDACGNTGRASSTLTVVDSTPPLVVADASTVLRLFPPRHGYECYGIADFPVTFEDACATGPLTWRFADCVSSQPEDERGDGHTTEDCRISADGTTACVRAERQGTEPAGRTYRLEVEAKDGCGNASRAFVGAVHVPHDRGRR